MFQVNGAARIESLGAGGQVLLSKHTYQLLDISTLPDVTFTDLGRFPLKGMAKEMEVLQAIPTRLSERRFPEISRRITTYLLCEQTCDRCSRPLKCHYCNAGNNVMGAVWAGTRASLFSPPLGEQYATASRSSGSREVHPISPESSM